ncbi:MAG: DUF58 domain-containing protein [Chromatiaceae bacterium]|nr:DUF58 domain-containing protein [Chromatiaceae bacterium]
MPGVTWHATAHCWSIRSRGARWTPRGAAGDGGNDAEWGGGSDDFAGLRGYRPGDLPSQIDWKSYARERGLNTRVFSGQAATPLWLDWVDAPGNDVELRVSALTRAVLDAESAGRHYGLRPGLDDCAGARSGPPPSVSPTSRTTTDQRCVMRWRRCRSHRASRRHTVCAGGPDGTTCRQPAPGHPRLFLPPLSAGVCWRCVISRAGCRGAGCCWH